MTNKFTQSTGEKSHGFESNNSSIDDNKGEIASFLKKTLRLKIIMGRIPGDQVIIISFCGITDKISETLSADQLENRNYQH